MNAASRWLRVAVVGLACLLMAAPLYLLLINSFKPNADILSSPFSIPIERLSLRYLQATFDNPNFGLLQAYVVSLLLVVAICLMSLVTAAPAAYAIARWRSRWSYVVLLYFVSGLFIPGPVLVLPVIFVLRSLQLMGTVPGLVLFQVATTLPVSIFLYYAFVRSIPRELDEAAAVDGAGTFRIFWRIILPLMRPAVVTMLILNGLYVWNDFVTPQIILGPASGLYTVTTGIFAGLGNRNNDYSVVFPMLFMSVVPALVFFIALQRHVISGLTTGATKG